jgi:hypothetical protein
MTLWIFDTDHGSLLQRQHPLLTQKLATVGRPMIATTIITAEEQLRGQLEIWELGGKRSRESQPTGGFMKR